MDESIKKRLKNIEDQLRKIEEILLNQKSEQEKPMTLPEAADFLGITKNAVYRKISRKQIPYYRESPSSKRYFFRSELIKYIKSFRQGTTGEIINKLKNE